MLDQGASAAIMFASGVFVGRTMGAGALGVFATTVIIVLAIRLLHAGMVLEPLVVYGPRLAGEPRRRYVAFVWLLHVLWISTLLALGASAAAGAAAFGLIDSGGVHAVLASLGFAAVLTTQYLLRRMFYADGRPERAMAQSIAYLALVLCGLAAYALVGGVTIPGLYAVLSAASLAVCLAQARRIPAAVPWPNADERRTHFRRHVAFGRWVALAAPVQLASYQGYFVLTSLLTSQENTGYLKAADSLVALFAQVMIGLSLMLVPIASRRAEVESAAAQLRFALRLSMATTALGAIFAALMIVGGETFIAMAYGRHLARAADILPILAAAPVFLAAGAVPAILLSAHARTKAVLAAQGCAALATALVGAPLVLAAGIEGAAGGMALTQGVLAAAQWTMALRLLRGLRPPPAAESGQ